MPDPDAPVTIPLTCGHSWTKGDPEPRYVWRVEAHGADWGVAGPSVWCVACAAEGRVPAGLSWVAAWAEVMRRRKGGAG